MNYEELHEQGAEQFGLRWLMMNQCLADVANTNGLDAHKNRLLLTRMAWQVCHLVERWYPRSQAQAKEEVLCYCCGQYVAEEEADLVGVGIDGEMWWCGCPQQDILPLFDC